MGKWRTMKFSEFVEVNPSISLSRAKDHYYIEMQDMDPARRWVYPKRKRPLQGGSRFAEGDTLFARISPCTEKGNINQVAGMEGESGYGSTEFLVFRAKPGVSHRDFVIYFSKWNEVRDYAANNLQGTSGRQRVAKEAFDELEVVIPSPKEQEVIAGVLGGLDAKIDLLHRQNKTLAAIAATLFKQWFVVEAESSWGWEQLNKHVEVQRGLSYTGAGLCEKGEGVPMHNLNSVYEGGGYKYNGIKYYKGPYRDRHIVRPGDVIVANTEQGHDQLLIGCPAIVPAYFGDEGIFSQHVYKLEILNPIFSNVFVAQLILTPDVREQITGATNGSTVNMLPTDGLEWAKFQMPPTEKIKRFNAIATPLHQKQEKNYIQIQTLIAQRDTLLPKLMSGEVRVQTP